ncbi:acetyl-CoA C-acyltransferase [Ichthyobacterium seriolicida]|uniref:acetyl-CoA C-acyltransferase n=1 Tax=Ichthyobacterium seriolicida TaxID=242600 RepID=A0A1J1E4F7_9FLAO|nr:acetyl-CoA C-acyltransferase [Ichthyobacterium seriolicida]BAV94932.1 acetyl-CoA acetyltransferase [Ichthyobacterium seriolicida]
MNRENRNLRDVYVAAAVRTPVGKIRGAFNNVRPDDLLVHTIKSLLTKAPVDSSQIGDLVVGCAMPEAEQGLNVARIAGLLSGLPDSVPAYTINRFCASGLQAVALAASQVAMGNTELAIGAGVESMSMVPMGGNKPSVNPSVISDDQNKAIAYGMGITAEKVSEKYGVSRQAQDEFALESHRRALKAISNDIGKDEITPVEVESNSLKDGKVESNKKIVKNDEGPRVDSSIESLSKLRPVFKNKGSVTAGNSSQMSDGAASLLLCSEQALKDYNLTPLARFLDFHVTGVPPEIMGIGPVAAIPNLLKKYNIKLEDVDWIELNEAFAAQALAVINELKLDKEKVNPLGGAIALGHPLGATGAIKATTAVHALNREKLDYAMVSMCIGTGMGASGLFVRV